MFHKVFLETKKHLHPLLGINKKITTV